jgi:hypothetical protein
MSESRANALKHGLTGNGTVLPPSLRNKVDARLTDWAPRYRLEADPIAQLLFFQLVLASVRMEACQHALLDLMPAQNEADLFDFNEDLTQAANVRFEDLAKEPAAVVADLRKTSAGCKRLARAWNALRIPLAHPTKLCWTPADIARAYDLLGLSLHDRRLDPQGAFLDVVSAAHANPETPDSVRSETLNTLRAWVDAHIAELETRAELLQTSTEATRKTLLVAGHTFTPNAEVKKLMRYEAMATRQFWKTEALLRPLNVLRPTENRQPTTDNCSPPLPSAQVAGQGPVGEAPPPAVKETQTLTMKVVKSASPAPESRFAPTLQPASLNPAPMSRHDRRRARKLQKAARA